MVQGDKIIEIVLFGVGDQFLLVYLVVVEYFGQVFIVVVVGEGYYLFWMVLCLVVVQCGVEQGVGGRVGQYVFNLQQLVCGVECFVVVDVICGMYFFQSGQWWDKIFVDFFDQSGFCFVVVFGIDLIGKD